MSDRKLKKFFFNQKEIAQIFGVEASAISQWAVRPERTKGTEKLYYLPSVIDYKLNRKDHTKTKLDLSTERARLAKVQTDKIKLEMKYLDEKHQKDLELKELDLAARRGALVPVAILRQLLGKVIYSYRAKKLSLASKTAHRLAAETSKQEIQKIISDAEEEILQSLEEVDFEELEVEEVEEEEVKLSN